MVAMKKINVSYAMRYNLKNNSIGHVFQDRFKSQPIEDDAYLMQVVRYIHQNPLKARMVSDVSEYEWSSYKTYLCNEAIDEHPEMLDIMQYFDNSSEKYKAFHKRD